MKNSDTKKGEGDEKMMIMKNNNKQIMQIIVTL